MRQSLESSLAFENLSKVLRLHFDGSSSIGGGRGLVAMLASILPPTLGRVNAFLVHVPMQAELSLQRTSGKSGELGRKLGMVQEDLRFG